MLTSVLPDITSDSNVDTPSNLQWVGMEDIAVPIRLTLQHMPPQIISSRANVYVSIDKPETKGIHMSRLYRELNCFGKEELTKKSVDVLLSNLISSQNGIAQSAKIELHFEILLEKPALISGESGYQSYIIAVKAEKKPGSLISNFELTIPYSSTCPCSASLAQQLYADAVNTRFKQPLIDKSDLLSWIRSPGGSIATPHSQRSYAYLKLDLQENEWLDISELVFHFEEVLATAVQTAVKREDEQEFAKRNAENLMFCEDAARRIKFALENMNAVEHYWFKVEHQESLHAHNAVVIDER